MQAPKEHDALLQRKVVPPLLKRVAGTSARLQRRARELDDFAFTVVEAPAGFGKTTFLLELGRSRSDTGQKVAWLTVGEHDDELHFLDCVLLSLHRVLDRPHRIERMRERLLNGALPTDVLTELLAELASDVGIITLIIDDVHQLPVPVLTGLLHYLMLNQPANLRLVLSSRYPLQLGQDQMYPFDLLAQVNRHDLRIRLDEAGAILKARLGDRIASDAIARLHETVDGWPLGLQMALMVAERSETPASLLDSLRNAEGSLTVVLADAMLASLPPEQSLLLQRTAVFDRLYPGLCNEVLERVDSQSVLREIHLGTPVLNANERCDSYRLHACCQTAMQRLFTQLPETERLAIHWRGAQWFKSQGMLEEAAHHALAAGVGAVAYEWIGQGLFAMVTHGRFPLVANWLQRIPEEQVAKAPLLGAAGAFANIALQRINVAKGFLARLATQDLPPPLRYAEQQSLGMLAYFDDQMGDLHAQAERLGAPPTTGDPDLVAAHVCMHSSSAIEDGDLPRALHHLHAYMAHFDAEQRYVHYFLQFFLASCAYLDGNLLAASERLEIQLGHADLQYGRRSAQACLLSCLYAACLWDQDQSIMLETILSDRLDVIERMCPPNALFLAYTSLARASVLRGNPARAMALLDGLDQLSQDRHLLRLNLQALAERAIMQAQLGLHLAADDTLREMLERRKSLTEAQCPGPRLDIALLLAQAQIALLHNAPQRAREHCSQAKTLMPSRWPERERRRMRLLDALANSHHQAADEILLMFKLNGDLRIALDFSPMMMGSDDRSPPTIAPQTATSAQVVRRNELLTPKETEVLSLLACHLSNKQIARELNIGGETARWHVKNIACKLDAGNRHHAVERAKLLGLIV